MITMEFMILHASYVTAFALALISTKQKLLSSNLSRADARVAQLPSRLTCRCIVTAHSRVCEAVPKDWACDEVRNFSI